MIKALRLSTLVFFSNERVHASALRLDLPIFTNHDEDF